MRILMANKFHYLRGGAERIHLLIDRLMTQAGHDTAHLCMRHPQNIPSIWDPHFLSEVHYDSPRSPTHAWKAARRLFGGREVAEAVEKIVADTAPDVAVLGNVYHQLGQSTLMATLARLGVPMVHMLHDFKIVCPSYLLLRNAKPCDLCTHKSYYHAFKHGCGGSRVRGLLLAAEAYHQSRFWALVDAFVSPSVFLIDQAHRMGFPFPIQLIRNPVSTENPYSHLREHTAVGYAGRLSAEKGLGVLIQAARRLPDIVFRIAGSGPLEDELRETAPANVNLLGFLSPDQLAHEMGSWQIAIVPSICYENAPGAVLEAYAQAIPVIGADHGGLSELLEYGGVGVKPGDPIALAHAIKTAWDDPARCRALGEAGRIMVENNHSCEGFSHSFENLLRKVVG